MQKLDQKTTIVVNSINREQQMNKIRENNKIERCLYFFESKFFFLKISRSNLLFSTLIESDSESLDSLILLSKCKMFESNGSYRSELGLSCFNCYQQDKITGSCILKENIVKDFLELREEINKLL